MIGRFNEIMDMRHLKKQPVFVELCEHTCSINADFYYLKLVCLKQRLRDTALPKHG